MFNDSIETAQLLIDAKSPLNIRDKEELGDPALPHAVGNHNAARMRLMLGFPSREDEAPPVKQAYIQAKDIVGGVLSAGLLLVGWWSRCEHGRGCAALLRQRFVLD